MTQACPLVFVNTVVDEVRVPGLVGDRLNVICWLVAGVASAFLAVIVMLA